MTSQYESSAGTNGPAGTYTSIDRPSVMTQNPVMMGPSQSMPHMRTRTKYALNTMSVPTPANSYILPHGTRSAASPRVTTLTRMITQANPVSEPAIERATS